MQVCLAGILAYAGFVRKAVGKAKGDRLDVSEKAPSGCPAVDDLVSTTG